MSTMRVEERMRGSLRENMTKIRVGVIGQLLWKELQEAQRMVILVPSSFPRYGSSIILN